MLPVGGKEEAAVGAARELLDDVHHGAAADDVVLFPFPFLVAVAEHSLRKRRKLENERLR